jgi:hypothetical protein
MAQVKRIAAAESIRRMRGCFCWGRNLSKAQNPYVDGKNIPDQAGSQPKTNSLQVQLGAVGVEWP